MMKIFTQIFTLIIGAVMLTGCSSPETGTTIKGTIENAGNMQMKLEKARLTGAMMSLAQEELDSDGSFKVNFPEGLDAGLYRLSVGNQAAGLILDGTEKSVVLNGQLADLKRQNFTVEGSQSTSDLNEVMSQYYAKRMSPPEIVTKSKSFDNPLVGMQFAFSTLGGSPNFIDLHEDLSQQVAQKFPESDYAKDYAAIVAQLKRKKAQEKQSAKIKIGEEAPDIKLPDPDGKMYSLSDLEGKVVLLDFWASWCRPCRRANPHVVEIYNKYKSEGFTVFSVSLDGLDERTKRRFSDPNQVQARLENSKQRWVQAIEQDNLQWDYHVSDLKKWDCAPAQDYGVRSIPRTFLIDREGKIAAINPRYNLEEEVQKLL
ncbi:MAG: TlpA disulfide reductase family protein [Saprospiraceae bacterium]|nr:TlpA disulfide reductase family protein [Saprospiraceae bacterium]